MFGLWITNDGSCREAALRSMLEERMIPLEGLTDEAPAFDAWSSREDFLRRAAAAVMQGRPLPMKGVTELLSCREALPGNVLRRYVFLHLSLLPYLRVHEQIMQLDGCILLGDDLLIVPMGEDGRIDAALPGGIWTELFTGESCEGRLRCIRGLNAMPVLARENSVIPIGVNDRSTHADDADRLTLLWFRPQNRACCTLLDGTEYRLCRQETEFSWHTNTLKPWHLVIRQNGEEILVK